MSVTALEETGGTRQEKPDGFAAFLSDLRTE